MALQRRMVYAQLAENKEFAVMSDKAQKTYIFLIVLADDDGRLKGDSDWLRIKIFPYDTSITVENMRSFIKEIVKAKLITWYKTGENYFIQHPNWEKYQILRADRKKESSIPPPNDNQVSTKRVHKISKLSKEKKGNITASLEYLKNIPVDDLFEWYKRFDCSKKALISKGEDLYNYCESKGKTYKNYKSFMLTTLKKDFEERKESDPRRNLKLVNDNGVMRMIPNDIQVGIKNLADKMSGKNNG